MFLTYTAIPCILPYFVTVFWFEKDRKCGLFEALGVGAPDWSIKESERGFRVENSEETVEMAGSFEGDRIFKAVDDDNLDL